MDAASHRAVSVGRVLLGAMVLVAVTGCANLVRSSVASNGAQGDGASAASALSDDGRYLAFSSHATNLVSGDTNTLRDVFVRDHQTNTTVRVSVGDDESQGNGESNAPSISDDGRLVAFESFADNLVPGDSNGLADIFVRDLVAGTTRRVSTAGGENPVISGNGRYVVYVARNAATSPLRSVISANLEAGTFTTVAADTSQPPLEPAFFDNLSISDDGAFVSYRYSVTHSTLHITFQSITLWDRATGTLRSMANAATPAVLDGGYVSGNGEWVTYSTQLDIVPEPDTCVVEVGAPRVPAACNSDVFVSDRAGGTIQMMSGAPIDGVYDESTVSSISDDGRVVIVTTQPPGPGAQPVQMHARDRGTTTTQALTGPVEPGDLEGGVVSGDARIVAIGSGSPLVADDTNLTRDVYVRATFIPSLLFRTPIPVAAGGAGVEVRLLGFHFAPDATLSAGTDVTVSNLVVDDAGSITATITAPPGAAKGVRNLLLVNPTRFPASNIGAASTVCTCLDVT